jgi:hypothetical protein
MFDISTISKRYFKIKLTAIDDSNEKHSIELEVEPPNVKALKSLTAISKAADDEAIDELTEAVQKMLSKNKSGYKVPMEYIDALNFDELQGILAAYFGWLADTKNSPN